MTIYYLMANFVEADEQHIKVFDIYKKQVIFDGLYKDMGNDIYNLEIEGIDTMYELTNKIVINVFVADNEEENLNYERIKKRDI